jgi:anti-sigma regulatory factor (Ser/Thr protein kinase)
VSSPANESVDIGPVEIRLPPDPALSRVLRLAASGMASMGGFTVDQIEDIKVTVSEVLLALIEQGGGAFIEVRFTIAEGSFEVLGRTKVDAFDAGHPDLELCRTVLTETADSHGIDHVDQHAHIWATVGRASPG